MSRRRRDTIHDRESSESPREAVGPSGDPGPGSERAAGDPGAADASWQLDEDGEPIFVVPIEEVIDLHSFQPREVLAVVDAYLDAAIERGFCEVRLIHGRGKGVQRANVQRSLGADARVERYADAPHERGGWGATLVWLRRAAPDSNDAA